MIDVLRPRGRRALRFALHRLAAQHRRVDLPELALAHAMVRQPTRVGRTAIDVEAIEEER